MVASTLHLNWHLPVAIRFGRGLLASFRPDQAAVVLADPSAISEATAIELAQLWGGRLIQWIWQDQRECELSSLRSLCPTVWDGLAQNLNTDLIAIGGGTTMDIAKVLRWRGDSQEVDQASTIWLAQGNQAHQHLLRHRLICWPTTAGTGSEVSATATLWDRSPCAPRKLAWQPLDGFADEAWVDPALAASCPRHVTRDCALDALSHALESLWNKRASFVSRILAQTAVTLIVRHLPLVLNNPNDTASQDAVCEASLLAGMAMSETQTALAHALSYDLTLYEGMSHGEAVATWLPFVAGLACEARPDLLLTLKDCLQTSDSPSAFLSHWLTELGIAPRRIADSKDGELTLRSAFDSARGRNQIVKETHAF